MEAAVRAFARKGYHSPRIGEIAEEAGVDEDIARAEQEVLVRRPRAVASDLAPVAKPRPAGGPMSKYAVAHLDEIDEISDGRCPSRRVRHHFGITSFGVNAWTGREAGDRIINEHDEADPGDSQEELYLVQEGRATFELDGERVDAPAGTFVFARPDVKRTAFAEEPGTTIVALGGTPGKAYEVSGWEVWMQFNPLYQSGEYAEAADRGRELIEASGYAAPLYNLACCESLAGRKSDAIQHLRLALEQREELRSLAAEDSDLDPIRGEAAFKELVG
jgi:Bacterial regulatory proteins, tetR family